MGIRDKNYNWEQEALDFSQVVGQVLKPIFNEYKDKFTFEEMYYLVCTEFHEIILDECLGLKHPDSTYARYIKE